MKSIILLAPDSPAGIPPAAAPSPAPSPAAAPSSAPAPAPDAGGSDENMFAAMDAKFKAVESNLAPKSDAPKKTDGGEGKPSPAAAPPSLKPVSPEPQKTPKELRAELERVRGEAKAASESKTMLEAKIAEYEAKGKDITALTARLEARDKEFEKLQGELRALKQEGSEDFKKQYDVPFNRAARYAERIVNGMTKIDGTKANFTEDFVPLYRMPFNQASEKSVELFGEHGSHLVMDQIADLQRLDFVKQEAFEEEKKGWATKQAEEDGKRVQMQEQSKELFARINTDLQNSVEAYRDPPDDKESAELRQEGYKIVDAPTKTAKETLLKFSHCRHRVAAFGPNQLKIIRQSARIAELEKQLADMKPKQPGGGGVHLTGGEEKGEPESWEEGARKSVESA